MKRTKSVQGIKSAIVAALCLACAASASAIAVQGKAASANSGPHYWYGSTGLGVISTGENCPLEVEKEVLDFNLPQLPNKTFTEKEFIKYSSENYVRAQYTFKNPTEEDITAHLAFPFGLPPEYGNSFYDYTTMFDADNGNFGVEINGEKIDSAVRHTRYAGGNIGQSFDFVRSVNKLSDDFRKDDFYSPETPVYSYWFTVNSPERSYFRAECSMEYDKNNIRLMSNSLTNRTDDGETYALVCGGDDIMIYAIGGELDVTKFSWTFCSQYGNKKISANVTLTGSGDAMPYKDFALKNRLPDSSVSEVDYYNVITDKLITAPHNYVSGTYMLDLDVLSLMRWFVYDITVPAGGTLSNTVTAPIYPNILSSSYEYTYLLSPAQNWNKFGSLEINIVTPFNLVGLDAFKKTENGYTCSYDGLPEEFDELSFRLTDKLPGGGGYGYGDYDEIITDVCVSFSICGVFLLFFAACMIWLGVSANKRKKKAQGKAEEKGKKYLK